MRIAGLAAILHLLVFTSAHSAELTNAHLQALAQVESGEDDSARGSRGEVSRYQILPSLWRRHARGLDWRDAATSTEVAARLLKQRIAVFNAQARREPAPVEVYCLWNAPGKFEQRGYNASLMPRLIRERATRYHNLVELYRTRRVADISPARPAAVSRLAGG